LRHDKFDVKNLSDKLKILEGIIPSDINEAFKFIKTDIDLFNLAGIKTKAEIGRASCRERG